MTHRRIFLSVLRGILMMWAMTNTQAGVLETLLMPGEVIEGHAEFESQCEKCHEHFGQTRQNQFCVECHKEVAQDITSNLGFHGRLKNISQLECRSCHTEHKGRKADIVLLDPDTFDHGATDYPLLDAHTKTACSSCHQPNKKFRDAPSQCVACHKSDDPHQGRLGKQCENCHNENRWAKAKFDHSKTKFPLLGAHGKITCAACHPNDSYRKIPTQCNACHQINDVHAGRFGEKCDTCHGVNTWKTIRFDHNRDTKYPLEGRHTQIRCNTCHTGHLYKDKLQTTCVACHRNDDIHKGRYDTQCQNCHSVQDWSKVAFNHDTKTKFALIGKHRSVACDTCHRGNLYHDKLATDCFACHQQDDPHHGQEGERCERCHNETNWGGKVVFDHGLTRFPLIGQHVIAPCEECHLSASFQGVPLQCIACHKADDTHRQSLGAQCEQCHNPNDWTLWHFNHNTQTDYKLDGGHADLICKACHKQPVMEKIELSRNCVSCHSNDDVHSGHYGNRCERCHTTKSFKEIRLN